MKRKFYLLISITIGVFLSVNSIAVESIPDSKEEILEELSNVLLGSLCDQNSFTMVCTSNAENCKSHMLKRINACNEIHSATLWGNSAEPDVQNWINVVYSCVGKGYLGEYQNSVKKEQGCVDGLRNFE